MESIKRYRGNKEMEIKFPEQEVAEIYFRNVLERKKIKGSTTQLAHIANALLNGIANKLGISIVEKFDTMDLTLIEGSGAMACWIRTEGIKQGYVITHDDGLTIHAYRQHPN
jgi:hypothetical protein